MVVEKGKVYLPELERLYIKENYSIDLLSKVFGVNMPDISRILWKYDLPQKKDAYYEALGTVPGKEKYRLDKNTEGDYKDGVTPGKTLKISSRSMEDDFFASLEGGDDI